MRNLRTKLRWTAVLVSGALLFLSSPAMADEPLPSTHTLEGLVSKWVNLRLQIAEEKESWKEQKHQLEQERKLFLKEKETLTEEIKKARQEQTSVEAERASLIKRKEVLKKTLDGCLPALSRAEANLKSWPGLLPSAMAEPLVKIFDKINRASEKPVSQRLQVVFSLYGEIERIQHSVQVVKETLKTESGRSQEMDVIYLGLARGFAVSFDDKLAAVGRPTRDGWNWEWQPEIASEVRKAISFYRRETTADFVHLPLMVGEIKQ